MKLMIELGITWILLASIYYMIMRPGMDDMGPWSRLACSIAILFWPITFVLILIFFFLYNLGDAGLHFLGIRKSKRIV